MKTFGIIISALLTAAFMFLGKERNPNFYLAAMTTGWLFFRLTVGSDCPAVWLMSKLGVKGLACPSDYKK
ncbi:MAG TPA: hypothetical protein DCS63_05840 [Elusimicrobia bacterium]|nr:hypothetical protein [Elusimicrobiota bacterium]